MMSISGRPSQRTAKDAMTVVAEVREERSKVEAEDNTESKVNAVVLAITATAITLYLIEEDALRDRREVEQREHRQTVCKSLLLSTTQLAPVTSHTGSVLVTGHLLSMR